jgi:hypothetical protein
MKKIAITFMFVLFSLFAMGQAKSLSQLMKSKNEIECFAFYFDIRPTIIKKNLDKYRVKYAKELKAKGYNPTNLETLIQYKVNFTNKGEIIKNNIIGKHVGKTVFHYEITD